MGFGDQVIYGLMSIYTSRSRQISKHPVVDQPRFAFDIHHPSNQDQDKESAERPSDVEELLD